MDLSFINLPASQNELLGLLKIAYKAGQESIDVPMKNQIVEHVHTGNKALIKPEVKYSFKGWLSRLANQWTDLQHS
jgi:hypothetical protein